MFSALAAKQFIAKQMILFFQIVDFSLIVKLTECFGNIQTVNQSMDWHGPTGLGSERFVSIPIKDFYDIPAAVANNKHVS